MTQASMSAPPRAAARPGKSARTGSRVGISDEGARLEYRFGIYDLTLPAAARSRALRDEAAEFALIVEEPLILLAYRFGESAPWSLARFAWQDGYARHDQVPPAPSLERGLIAVGRRRPDDGGTEPLRNLTLSLDFTRALDDAVRDQARMPSSPYEEDRAVESLGRRFPSIGALAARSVARSVGSP